MEHRCCLAAMKQIFTELQAACLINTIIGIVVLLLKDFLDLTQQG